VSALLETEAVPADLGRPEGRSVEGNGRLIKRSPLSDVIEVGALIIAVSGKARLWECLLQVAGVMSDFRSQMFRRWPSGPKIRGAP